MKINGNIASGNPQRKFGVNNDMATEKPSKPHSEQRLNRTGDDVASKASNENMRNRIHQRLAASQETQNTISQMQATDSALQRTQNVLQNALDNPGDTDLRAMTAQINNIAASSTFNDNRLLENNFAANLGLARNDANNTQELTQKAMENINSRRAELNTRQNSLRQTLAESANSIANRDEAREAVSSIRDRMLNNAANALNAQGNSIPQGVLQLVD